MRLHLPNNFCFAIYKHQCASFDILTKSYKEAVLGQPPAPEKRHPRISDNKTVGAIGGNF